MASLFLFSTPLFLLGWSVLLTTGLPLFDSGEPSAIGHLPKKFEPASEYPIVFDSGEPSAIGHLPKKIEPERNYPVVFDSETFGPRESLPLLHELENLTLSRLPSFRDDCNNSTSDVFLATSACPVHVFRSFDPNRIPRSLVQVSCKSNELPGHFGLGIFREQHVGCDEVTYKMPVLKMNPDAKRQVYLPSWENVVLACVPAIFPSRDLSKLNVEQLT